jgi:hypothetical protein
MPSALLGELHVRVLLSALLAEEFQSKIEHSRQSMTGQDLPMFPVAAIVASLGGFVKAANFQITLRVGDLLHNPNSDTASPGGVHCHWRKTSHFPHATARTTPSPLQSSTRLAGSIPSIHMLTFSVIFSRFRPSLGATLKNTAQGARGSPPRATSAAQKKFCVRNTDERVELFAILTKF